MAGICADRVITPARPNSLAGGGTSDQLAPDERADPDDAEFAATAVAADEVAGVWTTDADWLGPDGLLLAAALCKAPGAATACGLKLHVAACREDNNGNQPNLANPKELQLRH